MSDCSCDKYLSPVKTIEEINARCQKGPELFDMSKKFWIKIEGHDQGWLSLFQCRDCRKYWVLDYPFSGQHGGGPPCYYNISEAHLSTWRRTAESIKFNIVLQEDFEYIKELGEEVGPEGCEVKGCTSLTISNSTLCKKHHFEKEKKRFYPEN